MLAFACQDESRRLELWADQNCACRYVRIEADTEERLRQLLELVRKHLPVVELKKLIKLADKEMTSNPRSLVRLAFGAPRKYHQRVFETLAVGLEQSDPTVRACAAHAMGVLGWRQFGPPLALRAKLEESEELRTSIERAWELRCADP